jgi:cobalt/nickel transport system permease protein
MFTAALLAAVIGLQLGAFGVVLETLFSGKTELPFNTFVLLMQPIHLAIGLVEGLVTAAVAGFVWRARPEILEKVSQGEALGSISMKKVLSGLIVAALFTGGVLSWFASSQPDGLEWSMFKTAGVEELDAEGGVHEALGDFQQKVAILPDYSFKTPEAGEEPVTGQFEETAWPDVNTGTSVSGVIGGFMTLVLAVITGTVSSVIKRRVKADTA